jgi:hypothetical protein
MTTMSDRKYVKIWCFCLIHFYYSTLICHSLNGGHKGLGLCQIPIEVIFKCIDLTYFMKSKYETRNTTQLNLAPN